jgi:DNA-binding NtrC family response regulator
MIAEAMHAASPRAQRPLVVVDCGAVPANVVDSELFGHERGAFAGAFERKPGCIVDADGGTLFLDDVGALPADTQARLMNALDSGRIFPLGARVGRDVDVRVIAASRVPLAEEVAAGRFREDLLYRLAGTFVALPPLRDRADDLPALVRHLLARIARQPGLRELDITDEALALLATYDWPGNVRQLQNALFRAAVLSDADALTTADFPQIAQESFSRRRQGRQVADHRRAGVAVGGGVQLYTADGHLRPLDEIEADVIRLAIGHYRGRMSEVARRLGIGRSTLYRKLGDLGIDSAA